jgi:hypothetical protein
MRLLVDALTGRARLISRNQLALSKANRACAAYFDVLVSSTSCSKVQFDLLCTQMPTE